jgi:phosphoribosylanthranilate isomerase
MVRCEREVMTVFVKVCGITSVEDAQAAADAGADALGFVLAPSPRRVTPDQAREIIRQVPSTVLTVGVFVDASLEDMQEIRDHCGLGAVQLHGNESEEKAASVGGTVIKALRVGKEPLTCEGAYPKATLLLDTYSPTAVGGTGKTFDWNLAVETARKRPIFLAGGLTPDNIIEAIEMVRPYAVDVSSGVEAEPGRKDHEKLERFIRRAKSVE